ncbi:tetratricopeptide repeat protein [Flavobacterium zepuense]|uniref:histidine kinase n=1 Tax=Flavobacterium zepuense TaxID=2593302 RepID=A0A552V9Y3_9FLAO|nr:histidine kinase dimerization/phosphoacceptor domain -containing protein [Flavobacterium zepuense]TRW27281.1 tetratricopeptide repeat protein [Flavobacterium zepuense]
MKDLRHILVSNMMVFLFAGSALPAKAGAKNCPAPLLFVTENIVVEDEDFSQLLKLSELYLTKSERTANDLIQAEKFAKKALQRAIDDLYEKGIAQGYFQLSKITQEQTKYKDTKYYALKAVDAFKKLKEPELLGEAQVMVWSANVLLQEPVENRIALLEAAASSFRKAGNKKREADCYNEMGTAYNILGNATETILTLKRALSLYNAAGYKHLNGLYCTMGEAYVYLGDYKQGIAYELLAAKNMDGDSYNDMHFLGMIYNRIGMAYEEMSDYEPALKYFKLSLELEKKCDDKEGVFELSYNIGNILVTLKKYDEAIALLTTLLNKYPVLRQSQSPVFECVLIRAYTMKNQHNKAASYVKIAKNKIKNNNDFNHLCVTYSTLIPYYIRLKNYDEAEKYAFLYESLTATQDKKLYRSFENLFKYEIDSARGNSVKALEYYRNYVKYSQDMYDESKAKEISQLNILYETEKKDRNITELRDRYVMQQSSLKNAQLLRNIMLGCLLLFCVIIFLLYRSYRVKQKNNKALSIQQDEINRKNSSLELVVKEKEWLIKEIHHRVKNNLQMVVGLLASQTEFLKGKEAVGAILESQRRVEAMAIIHQKLYQSDNLSIIDMKSYILELTSYLNDSFDRKRHIRYEIAIDDIQLPLSHSIPLGLILNEAITNSIKYAFPNDKEGIITIQLKKADDLYHLIIWDNGIGLPPDFDMERNASLGLRLIQGLADDIQGLFKIYNDNGSKIEITFGISHLDHE